MILSPSPPPQPAQQLRTQSPVPRTDTTPSNLQVASLKTIFPDFDEAVILSVLESTNNDHDRALDALLGMSDPSFVPSAPPQPLHQSQVLPSSDAQRLSQEALDEQLAHRLALEEEQVASREWQPQGVQAQPTYQSYQPRQDARWGAQSQPQGPGGKDTMTEFQEGFNRIAESGKKTFTSIVSKVRAKMQEYDQGQSWSGSAGPPSSVPPNQPPTQAQGSFYQSYAPSRQQSLGQVAQQPPDSQWKPSQPLPVRESSPTWSQSWKNKQSFSASSPPRSGVLRPSTAESADSGAQPSSYYDPNAQGFDLYGDEDETPITLRDDSVPAAATSPSTAQSNAPISTGISSTQPPASDDASVHSADPPSYKSRVASPTAHSSLSPPTRSLSPTSAGSAAYVQGGASTTRSSTGRTAGGSVDFSKLGLLPKRPISLVSPPASGASGAVAPRMASADSESSTASTAHEQEEPEFVDNPFENR